MNKYTIYCTPEQTKKALGLGAPIKTEVKVLRGHFTNDYIFEDGNLFVFRPTSEQMIGWLEEQGIVDYYIDRDTDEEMNYLDTYGYFVDFDQKNKLVGSGFSTRKAATIAAIDAALEHLSNRKDG